MSDTYQPPEQGPGPQRDNITAALMGIARPQPQTPMPQMPPMQPMPQLPQQPPPGAPPQYTGRKNDSGYGLVIFNKKNTRAHRVAWEFAYGDIPHGKWVLHHCDNPGCVNPEHLFLGDNAANVRDMHRKGRGRGGLGPDTAYAILWMNASGFSRKRIMKEYDVSLHVAKDVVGRRRWKSLFELHD
jgi:hypothetical protein